MRQLLRRAWYLLRQRKFEAELAEELDFHRSMKQRELEDGGAAPSSAAAAARRALGSGALAQDHSHDVWCPRWLQGVVQDTRLAVRTLLATRVVTIVAVLSLALGIGANAAIFSLVNSLILRVLPVKEPQRLAIVASGPVNQGVSTGGWTYAIWQQIQARADAFGGALAWSSVRFNLADGGEMDPVNGLFVSGDYFSMLGVTPLIGRAFTAADDVRGGGPDGPIAVISYGLWQQRFGGAAGVVGTPIVVDRVPFTIIGVMPPAFFGTEVGRAFDVALPIGTEPLTRGKDTALDIPSRYWLTIMLRLKPGQSIQTATLALRAIQPQIREGAMPRNLIPRFQEEFLKAPFVLTPAATGTSGLRQQYQQPLLTILVVVGLVLLIACANITNLLLARATARRHELSLRRALGASSWRLGRQLLIESLVLSGLGMIAGLLVAGWGSRALVAQLSTSVNRVFLDLSLDWRVLAFTAVITVTTALVFGTAPAIRASRVSPMSVLKEQGRGPSARGRLSGSLIVTQVALSLVLVVLAGLFVRTFAGLAALPLGFDSDRLLVVNVNATRAHIDPSDRFPFYGRLAEALGAVPGVAYAAGSFLTPVSNGGLSNLIDVSGAPPMSEQERSALVNFVTPHWFATYGTTILVGRDIDEHDTKNAPPVVLVNEAFVRKFFPDRNPLSATVTFVAGRPGEVQTPKAVIGVVADSVYRSIRDGSPPTMYVPMTQFDIPIPMSGVSLAVRSSSGSPIPLARSVAAALIAVDPDLSFNFRPLTEQVNASLTQERIIALLSALFGGLALLLAGLGLYGVTSYAVSRRRNEIGLRIALGAASTSVVRLVLSRVVILVALGTVIGGMVSLWASRFVATLLYGLEPRDPATIVGAAFVLLTVAILAALRPALHASRIDPAVTLRYE